jgi:hypothetical protein
MGEAAVCILNSLEMAAAESIALYQTTWIGSGHIPEVRPTLDRPYNNQRLENTRGIQNEG